MTTGKLRKAFKGGVVVEAEIGPDGWAATPPEWAAVLEDRHPPPGDVYGSPWVRAFWAAVEELGAEVVQEPEADFDPNVIY